MIKRFIILMMLIVVAGAGVPARSVQALQTSPGPMERMMAQVTDNAVSRTVIMYGAIGDLEKLLGFQLTSANDFRKLTRQQQTAYLLDVSGRQIYYSPFSGMDRPSDWQKTFGINPYSIDRELTVGASPNWFDILQGQFSSSAIATVLENLGFKAAPVGSSTVYSLGGDNAQANGKTGAIAGARYNRVVVTDTQIIAAPSTSLIQMALNNTKPLLSDPTYAALIRALETPALASNTQLVSAAIFSGAYLSNTIITADPLAASVGSTMSASDMAALRTQLGLDKEKLLPRYETAGIGYRRSATTRNWSIALVYKDATTANNASTILSSRLARYGSFQQAGRMLFRGWRITSKVSPSSDGSLQVVFINLQLPSQTDVSWLDLIEQRDLGFLATER